MERVDRDLPLYDVGTPAQHYDNALAQNRVIAGMFSMFGLVAVMAAVGLYGVMSFSVNQRRQELGVPMALGARRRHHRVARRRAVARPSRGEGGPDDRVAGGLTALRPGSHGRRHPSKTS